MDEIIKATKTSALAIWSLVLGILSIVMCLGIFSGIPAVICGHMAHSRIKKSGGTEGGGGMAIAGLITGYVGNLFGLIMVVGILASITIPNFVMYKERAICSKVEEEAGKAASAVVAYMAESNINYVPTLTQLTGATGFSHDDDVTVSFRGTLEEIKVTATDATGKCPEGQVYVLTMPESVDDGWQ